MGQYAVGVVATIILALYIHAFGKGRHHWHMGIIIGIFTTIAAAVFAAAKQTQLLFLFPNI